jgi:hypothetical protein
VKVRIREIEACCPHTRVDTRSDGTIGFHFEMGYQEKRIQDKKIYNSVFCSVPLFSCRRETYSLSESMGENYHGLVGSVSNSGGGTSSSVSEVTSTVRLGLLSTYQGFHFEMGYQEKHIQDRKIYNWSHTLSFLRN